MANPLANLSTGEKIAIAGGSLLAVWFAWKQHQSSTGASTSASAIDPLTGLPTSEDNTQDPITGETYLGEAQQYGSVSAAEQALSGSGLSGGYYGTGGSGLVGTSTGASLVPANVVGGTSYATNAAWAQAVEAGLTDIGYAPTDISAALGRYLGGLSETAAQAGIVQAAIAEYGPPPVGQYQVIQAPTTGPAVSGNTTPSKSLPAAGGLSATPYKGSADFGWHAVPGATEYHVQVLKGSSAVADQHTAATDLHGVTLPAGTYTWQVAADANTSFKSGPWARGSSFTVK